MELATAGTQKDTVSAPDCGDYNTSEYQGSPEQSQGLQELVDSLRTTVAVLEADNVALRTENCSPRSSRRTAFEVSFDAFSDDLTNKLSKSKCIAHSIVAKALEFGLWQGVVSKEGCCYRMGAASSRTRESQHPHHCKRRRGVPTSGEEKRRVLRKCKDSRAWPAMPKRERTWRVKPKNEGRKRRRKVEEPEKESVGGPTEPPVAETSTRKEEEPPPNVLDEEEETQPAAPSCEDWFGCR